MIYTITFNPSLDYIVNCDDFRLGETNRVSKEIIFPGGKGINVSIVLSNFGLDTTALGFLAGFTGEEIKKLIVEKGIRNEMIQIDNGYSRINVKLRSKQESELNGMGPRIDDESIRKLYRKLDDLNEKDILCLAGSIPDSMPSTMYSDIMKYLDGRGIRIVVDATKDLLKNVLEYRPFLIKPNNHELGEIFGKAALERFFLFVFYLFRFLFLRLFLSIVGIDLIAGYKGIRDAVAKRDRRKHKDRRQHAVLGG